MSSPRVTAGICRRSRAGHTRASRRIISSRSIWAMKRRARKWLVANGWIYPTDSSINVAIGQAGIQPHGLSLEAQDEAGRWIVVAADLGFPAGKNKTILIDLGQVARAGIAHARRVRLRTNLEIYWDSLAIADAAADDAIADDASSGGDGGASVSRLLEDRLRETRRPRDAEVRRAGERRPALARSRRLLHALRRRRASCCRRSTIAT